MPRIGRRPATCPNALLLAGALAAILSVRCGARSDLGTSDGGAVPIGTVPVTPPGAVPDATTPPGTTPACSDAVLGTDPTGAAGLAAVGTDVYWSTVDGHLMQSAHDAPGQPLAAGLFGASDVTVFGGVVYFADQTRVMSVPTNDASGSSVGVIATGQSYPIAVVADAGGVWWLNHGAGTLAGSIVASLAGGVRETIIDQIDTPSDLVMDGTHLYFAAAMANVNGKIEIGPLVRIPKAGGAPELLSLDLHQPAGMALDAAHLYWLERVNPSSSFPGRLRRSPKSGGAPPIDLASTQDVLTVSLAVDDRFAYVTGLQGTGTAAHGVLWRVALVGGAVTEIARTAGTSYGAVAVTDAAVYWTIGWAKGAQPAGAPSVRKICKRW